ncbi:spermatogenesis-associated protein 45-like [Lates japonicus]|uniref:Spermatogenesis-associated protein 45-like protein n=1 Tax=Lates japonicus TaxID=270547 RepID=A0AAD3R6R5_LATJO|nr:spermatogenesis-associated protein 45-like protein [Lates japonicus]
MAMSGSGERALLELNLRRETWCQVEMNPRQSWERTERRHCGSHLRTSPVLLTALTAAGPQRSRTARTERPPPVKLPERRHFEESYKSHLV